MIAVLDIGKTNAKLSVASGDGVIVETLSTPNPVCPAPPYRHHDLATLEDWLLGALAELGSRHAITAIVPCGHGSGGVLVNDAGPAMPMIDYEDTPPAALDAMYHRLAGSFRERGSVIMLGASHLARQMLWLQTGWPQRFAAARWFLGLPQYWAWRLSGVAASEVTTLAAQSHLWSAATSDFAPIVETQGWARLLPPLAPAWRTLGPLRPDLAARTGLSVATRVLCGIHDSSANFYRYQAAGLARVTVVSTGTWIVALTDERPACELDEASGIGCNADPQGRPVVGALLMGGREFSAIAGDQPQGAVADRDIAARLVARDTLAVPCFDASGLRPGDGHIVGPPPCDAAERRALALLATALLTDRLLDSLGGVGSIVLDGSFVRDPLYPALVAAFRPQQRILFNLDSAGSAAGAALLAGHAARTSPAPLALQSAPPLDIADLAGYRARWRRLARASTTVSETA